MASSQIAHCCVARHQTSGGSHIKMSATFRAASTPSKLQFTSSSSIASISPLNTTNARLHSTVAFTARTSVLSVRSERSYIMIKPDGVQRGLVGGIISRFENKGFKLVGLKMFQCTKAIAEEHYKDLSSKPFFPDLVDYIISGPVICMIWEGNGVVKSARKLIGATNPLESEPGTIRGDLAIQTGRNVVHGSDSPENGEREIGLWFKSEEILAWNSVMMPWLTE